MASAARGMPDSLLGADLRGLVTGARRLMPESRAATVAPADLRSLRALAYVGFGALLALPALLLASLVSGAPLAAPAGLAIGYLAVAHAMARGETRQAAAWSALILAGLASWTLLLALAGGTDGSWRGLAAIGLAPGLAAAPAVTRWLIGRRDRVQVVAAERAACLDQLAPQEAVLFLDRSARLIAATRAGLDLLGGAVAGRDVELTRLLPRADRPAFASALAACLSGSGPVQVEMRGLGPNGQARAATLTHGPRRTAALRVEPAPTAASAERDRQVSGPPAGAAPAPSVPHPPISDLAEAIGFALPRAAGRARAQGILLLCEGDSEAAVAADRRLCRRIVQQAIDLALAETGEGGSVALDLRRLRGAVRLRVCARSGTPGSATPSVSSDAVARSGLIEAVDLAGGTLMVAPSEEGFALSIRLASAPPAMAHALKAGRSG